MTTTTTTIGTTIGTTTMYGGHFPPIGGTGVCKVDSSYTHLSDFGVVIPANSNNRISSLLKDTVYKEISLCKSKEECKELYGSKGLELYDSLLNEVLQEAIKSEELFNNTLQKEQEKIIKLKDYILSFCSSDEDKLKKSAELISLIGLP